MLGVVTPPASWSDGVRMGFSACFSHRKDPVQRSSQEIVTREAGAGSTEDVNEPWVAPFLKTIPELGVSGTVPSCAPWLIPIAPSARIAPGSATQAPALASRKRRRLESRIA